MYWGIWIIENEINVLTRWAFCTVGRKPTNCILEVTSNKTDQNTTTFTKHSSEVRQNKYVVFSVEIGEDRATDRIQARKRNVVNATSAGFYSLLSLFVVFD